MDSISLVLSVPPNCMTVFYFSWFPHVFRSLLQLFCWVIRSDSKSQPSQVLVARESWSGIPLRPVRSVSRLASSMHLSCKQRSWALCVASSLSAIWCWWIFPPSSLWLDDTVYVWVFGDRVQLEQQIRLMLLMTFLKSFGSMQAFIHLPLGYSSDF